MANPSIYAAFERMWQHILAKIGTRFNESISYTDEAVAELSSNVAYIDENDNETITLSVDLDVLASLVGGDL